MLPGKTPHYNGALENSNDWKSEASHRKQKAGV
jgi:hypothetical protein